MKDNWKIVCDKISTTKDLLEMPFEKGVASLILSGLGWNDFNDNIEEQYVISDHIKDYRVDFALIPKGKSNPEILVELKKTSHKQRKKDIAQIRTYMMLTNCRKPYFIEILPAARSGRSFGIVKGFTRGVPSPFAYSMFSR